MKATVQFRAVGIAIQYTAFAITIVCTTTATTSVFAAPTRSATPTSFARKASGIYQGSFRYTGSTFLKAGVEFHHYRFPYIFQIPMRSALSVSPRGVYPLAQIKETKNESFYIAHTVFAIRSTGKLKEVASELQGPCSYPDLPGTGDFRLQIFCKFRRNGTKLRRHILLQRKMDRLYILYVTGPEENYQMIEGIMKSVRINNEFYDPGLKLQR